MTRTPFSLFQGLIVALALFSAGAASVSAQRAQEVSEVDGIPVLIKHLPDWEKVRGSTIFITDNWTLAEQTGRGDLAEFVNFSDGTEAVVASYPAGKLLLIEFATPQAAADADSKITASLASATEPRAVYRRIGNYGTFVLEPASDGAANALLDRIKYEKNIQWLGEDPFLLQKLERYFVTTTRDIFVSTVLWIVGGFGLSIILGVITGFIFFKGREQKRAGRQAFSDAGGLVRLNLDDLSER